MKSSVKKVVVALIFHRYFNFTPKDFIPAKEFQYAHICFVYAIKLDLANKTCFVCNNSWINPKGISTCATVVNGTSVQHLEIIAEPQGLPVQTGDIGNSFILAETTEKV